MASTSSLISAPTRKAHRERCGYSARSPLWRCRMGGMLLAIAVAACSPIDTWRNVYGISRNDPDPATAPFTQNLADAEAAPYPNLASVPLPPTRATTAAERQKLAQSLVADRAAAETAAGPRTGATAMRDDVSPSPTVSAAQRHPAPTVASATAPTVPPPSAGTPGRPALTATAPGGKTASAAERSPGQTGRRAANQPPETAPRESTLQVPDVRAVPEPEAARPAPPPPSLAAAPRPAPASQPTPAALASVAPAPTPPIPDMPPAPPSPPVGKATAKHPPVAPKTVATLAGPGGAAGRDRTEIDRVAALYQRQPGAVRVVAYAAAPTAGADPLSSYQTALDRAQAVAKALTAAGIPAAKIQTEANPASGAIGRVDIQFVPDTEMTGARQ